MFPDSNSQLDDTTRVCLSHYSQERTISLLISCYSTYWQINTILGVKSTLWLAPLVSLIKYCAHLAPFVGMVDSAIGRLNFYVLDGTVCFVNTYPVDSNFSAG